MRTFTLYYLSTFWLFYNTNLSELVSGAVGFAVRTFTLYYPSTFLLLSCANFAALVRGAHPTIFAPRRGVTNAPFPIPPFPMPNSQFPITNSPIYQGRIV